MKGWQTPRVAQVPSAVVRLSASPNLAALVDAWADRANLPRDEALEVLIRSRLADREDDPAARLWRGFEQGDVQSVDELAAALRESGVTAVIAGVRLGPHRPDATGTPAPWPRPGIGVDLDATPTQAWPQIRGLWRIKMKPSLLVGLRLGWAGWVYRVAGWKQHESGRSFAVGGVAITADGHQIDMQTGEVSAADPTDVVAVRLLQRAPISFPRSVNPVVRLATR